MRSPNWHECEVKLALHLYLNKELSWVSKISDSTFEIKALSKLLNGLDFYKEKPSNFRSTGSIRMKLANFMALDDRYEMNSLGNVGSLDKFVWDKYSNRIVQLHQECVDILKEHLIIRDQEIDSYIKEMNLITKDIMDPNFSNFISMLRRGLDYYEKLAGLDETNENSQDVIRWCKKTRESLQWTEKANNDIVFEIDNYYIEHAGVNLVPIKKKNNSRNIDTEIEEKIGKLVQRTFSEMVEQNKITDKCIDDLLDPGFSKKTFGLKPTFLVKINNDKPLRSQLTDSNGYVRYWKTPIEINGNIYCVTKEWYPNQRDKYLRWLSTVNVKTFYMIKTDQLVELLLYLQETDLKKVSILRSDICKKFEYLQIEEIIDVLLKIGILARFQGSMNELVIEDYDLLFKVLKNPIDYAVE